MPQEKEGHDSEAATLEYLSGFLNFLCRCVVPGRAFTRQIYSLIDPKLKQHHHVNITGELIMHLRVWKQFLAHPTVFCCPFSDFSSEVNANDINLSTDASKNHFLGAGGCCYDKDWFFVGWDPIYIIDQDPSIEYLELYAVTSSSCRNCMILIRLIGLKWNVVVKARYIKSWDNEKSFPNPRCKFELFHRLTKFSAN